MSSDLHGTHNTRAMCTMCSVRACAPQCTSGPQDGKLATWSREMTAKGMSSICRWLDATRVRLGVGVGVVDDAGAGRYSIQEGPAGKPKKRGVREITIGKVNRKLVKKQENSA